MKGTFTLLFKAKQASGPSFRCLLYRMGTTLQHSPPTVPAATESDASVSCRPSSHLWIPRKGLLFLPRRPRPAARFEKKDVLGLVTHPAGRSSVRLHRGQSDWKKHI